MKALKATINTLFFAADGRLRDVFKGLSFVLLFQVIGVILIRLIIPLVGDSPFYLSWMINMITATSVMLALVIYVRWIDKSAIQKYGLTSKKLSIHTLVGASAALCLIALAILLQGSRTSLDYNPGTSIEDQNYLLVLGTQVIRYLFGSLFEELLATSFLFVFIYELRIIKLPAIKFGTALAITSIVFGLLHGLNPNATFLGVFNLMLFGMLTSIYFFKSKSIVAPIAFHAFWNLTQNNLFGLANSGQESMAWILQTSLKGPDLLTGGAFGLEGSLLLTLPLLIVNGYELYSIRNSIYHHFIDSNPPVLRRVQ